MKNLIKIIFVLSFLLPVCVQGQAVTWQRYFNYDSGHDYAQDAIQTFDGGYLTVGYGRSSSVFIGAFILKTDYLGNVEWKKFIGEPSENRKAHKVKQVSDSGYIIVGESYSNFLIFKTNKNGEVIWEHRYPVENSSEARGYSFVITDDGFIVACGDVFFNSLFQTYPYIVKTDMSGNLTWKKYYNDMIDVTAGDIVKIENNEYVFCVTKYLRKIDSSGNVLSTNSYWSGSGFLTIDELVYEYPGIIYGGGTSGLNGQWSFHLLKVNTSDSLFWSKRILNPENEISDCRSICLLNGNIYMTGVYNIKGVVPFAKVSSEGDLLIYNLITESQAVESYGLSIQPANDNGFILSGSTRFGTTFSYKYLVIKTDSNGYAPELVNIRSQTEYLDKFELYQNYPNPFNPYTTISYNIQRQAFINISVFDINGKKIKEFENGNQSIGSYSVRFDGSDLPSGIYFYQLRIIEGGISKKIRTKKMFLIK